MLVRPYYKSRKSRSEFPRDFFRRVAPGLSLADRELVFPSIWTNRSLPFDEIVAAARQAEARDQHLIAARKTPLHEILDPSKGAEPDGYPSPARPLADHLFSQETRREISDQYALKPFRLLELIPDIDVERFLYQR